MSTHPCTVRGVRGPPRVSGSTNRTPSALPARTCHMVDTSTREHMGVKCIIRCIFTRPGAGWAPAAKPAAARAPCRICAPFPNCQQHHPLPSPRVEPGVTADPRSERAGRRGGQCVCG
eukprot:3289280-Prymnesium_polylepis.1